MLRTEQFALSIGNVVGFWNDELVLPPFIIQPLPYQGTNIYVVMSLSSKSFDCSWNFGQGTNEIFSVVRNASTCSVVNANLSWVRIKQGHVLAHSASLWIHHFMACQHTLISTNPSCNSIKHMNLWCMIVLCFPIISFGLVPGLVIQRAVFLIKLMKLMMNLARPLELLLSSTSSITWPVLLKVRDPVDTRSNITIIQSILDPSSPVPSFGFRHILDLWKIIYCHHWCYDHRQDHTCE